MNDAAYYVTHDGPCTTVHISHPLAFWLAEQLAKRLIGLNVEGGSDKGTVWVAISHPPRGEAAVMGLIASWGHENGLHKVVGEVN